MHSFLEIIDLIILIFLLNLLLLILIIAEIFIDKLLLRIDVLHGTDLNHLVIVSGLDLLNGFPFVDHNLETDLAEVIHQHIFLYNKRNIWTNFKQIKPFVLSDEESFHMGESSVYEGSSFIEGDAIGSDNTLVIELDAVSSLFVDLISDDNLSFAYEADFIELI